MAVFQSRVNVERCHFWNGLTKYKHGALFVHLAKVNLTSSAFSNNIPIKLNGGSGGSTNHTNATDIFVDDDIPPSSGSGGSFVRCNNEKITGPSPVNFCNGLDGIVESSGDGGSGDAFDNNTNTNCHINGIVDPTSEACGTWGN